MGARLLVRRVCRDHSSAGSDGAGTGAWISDLRVLLERQKVEALRQRKLCNSAAGRKLLIDAASFDGNLF